MVQGTTDTRFRVFVPAFLLNQSLINLAENLSRSSPETESKEVLLIFFRQNATRELLSDRV